MARRKMIGFEAALFEGHKGVHAVIVPFDPRAVWELEPTALDPRREGWLVAGTVNGVTFEGWIGFRWGRFFLIVDAALRALAKVVVGDRLELAVAPTTSATALAIAQEQAVLTTAPRKRSGNARKAPAATTPMRKRAGKAGKAPAARTTGVKAPAVKRTARWG
jgi:hypothetical protein